MIPDYCFMTIHLAICGCFKGLALVCELVSTAKATLASSRLGRSSSLSQELCHSGSKFYLQPKETYFNFS